MVVAGPSLVYTKTSHYTGTSWDERTTSGGQQMEAVAENHKTGPLAGIKVVEMGIWVAGPAAAAVLGDWGA